MRRVLVIAAVVGPLVAAPAAHASDAAMLAAAGQAPSVASATSAAHAGAPDLIQRAYDRSRTMREALRAAGRVSRACTPYATWTATFADASVDIANGYDRLSPSRVRSARLAASAARAKMRATRGACTPGTTALVPQIGTLTEPRPGAAFFGNMFANRPNGTTSADLVIDGRVAGPLALRANNVVWARLVAQPGRYNLTVRFHRNGRVIGKVESRGVWLLPNSARLPVRAPTATTALQAALKRAAGQFRGVSGIWVHDLATGEAGSWNAGAKFAAASTVKLGVMVEALRRTGARPDRSPLAYEAAAIGAWSSNLAPNRLMALIGGAASAQTALRRIGATSSTYPGNYIVATAKPPVNVVNQPTLRSRRITTAADMGAAITLLHRAARGEASALSAARMTVPQARLLLGNLLAADGLGDNAGIVRQAFSTSVPMAQKHGWISTSRHTVSIAYTKHGPVVVVILTNNANGMTRERAAALGTAVVRALRGSVTT